MISNLHTESVDWQGELGETTVVIESCTKSTTLQDVDGFLISDGFRAQITLREDLDAHDVEVGILGLIQHIVPGKPGIYLWKVSDGPSPLSSPN